MWFDHHASDGSGDACGFIIMLVMVVVMLVMVVVMRVVLSSC